MINLALYDYGNFHNRETLNGAWSAAGRRSNHLRRSRAAHMLKWALSARVSVIAANNCGRQSEFNTPRQIGLEVCVFGYKAMLWAWVDRKAGL